MAAKKKSVSKSKKSKTYKPRGYTSVSPYLITGRPEKVLAFFEKAFNGIPKRRHEDEGRVVHAEVQVGDSIIMMGDPGDGSTLPAHIHIYVEDVVKTYARALKAGGKTVQKPADKGDGDIRGGVMDPSKSVTVWIATEN